MASGRRMWMYGGVTLLAVIIFHNEQHTDLRGKEARVQVLKYYNRDNSKEVKGTDNCDEEQTQQTRSRTALTHQGPSSRLFRRCLRKRFQ